MNVAGEAGLRVEGSAHRDRSSEVKPRNVLVFPAGTEIGLEILRALLHCKEVRLFGCGQDISNHGRFAYPNYHVLPRITEDGWLRQLVELCTSCQIEYIFPAYDDIIVALRENSEQIPARIITSGNFACRVCRSKSATYRLLSGSVRVPALYEDPDAVPSFPVLVKPDRGQGTQGVCLARNPAELAAAVSAVHQPIICEYLPGEEYTVDCFSDRDRGLLFAKARCRRRIRNGISVNTAIADLPQVSHMAASIGRLLGLRGAWFFQLKRSQSDELALLEVAPRISGSMAANRVSGVNFPLLSIFEEERLPIAIRANAGPIELDRALCNRYRHTIRYATLYIDLDDTLVLNGNVNTQAIKLVYQAINAGKKVVLITRNRGDLAGTLARYRLTGLFDAIHHLEEGTPKSGSITESDAILVDDSFSERREVGELCGIPTFDCSMIEMLTEQAEDLNEADHGGC